MRALVPYAAVIACLGLADAVRAADYPFVWEVQGPRAQHCLVGSVRGLPVNRRALPANVEACFRRAGVVVVEAVARVRMDEATYVRELGGITEPGGLERRIGPDLYRKVSLEAAGLGLSAGQLRHFRPWFAAQILSIFRSLNANQRPHLDVDRQLYWRAQDEHKPVLGLDTDDEHARLFVQMEDEAAIEGLRALLEQPPPGAWGSVPTDHDELARRIEDARQRYPAYDRRMVASRNRAWLPALQKMLATGTSHLIVADAAHFVGPESLRERLESSRIVAKLVVAAEPQPELDVVEYDRGPFGR